MLLLDITSNGEVAVALECAERGEPDLSFAASSLCLSACRVVRTSEIAEQREVVHIVLCDAILVSLANQIEALRVEEKQTSNRQRAVNIERSRRRAAAAAR